MSHRNIRRCLLGTAFAGGLLALGGVAANAADTTSGTDGLLSGTQVAAPITVPVNLGATSLGLLGDSAASTETAGTAAPAPAPAPATTPAASTSGTDGIASGTQVVAPITVPVNLGATSVGLIGDSAASVEGSGTGAGSTTSPAPAPAPAGSTSGTDGIASGTQVVAPVTAPINLGATSVGLIGDSAASVEGSGTGAGTTTAPAGAPAGSTSGTDGIASGTQVVAPITVPVNLGATSVGLIGDSAASVEGSGAGPGTTTSPAAPVTTSGTDGVLSGTQIVAPITLPVSLGATSIGTVGDSTATVVTPPVVTTPVVTPPVVTPPVVTPPIVAPPVVNPPTVTTPDAEVPAVRAPAGNTEVRAAAGNTAQMALRYSAAPTVLANTGVDTGLLTVGLLFLAFGVLLTLVLRRKRS